MARTLTEANLKPAVYATTRWNVVPPDGTTLEDMLVPAYWMNVSRKLSPGDILEVHAPDGTFYAELYVRFSTRLETAVVVLRKFDFEAVEAPAPVADYEVKFRNPSARYGVVRKSDKTVMKDGFQTAELAHAWLADYRKAMAA